MPGGNRGLWRYSNTGRPGGLPWDTKIHAYGPLSYRPTACDILLGLFYFATDVNGGTIYQCQLSSGNPAWVALTPGTYSAGSGLALTGNAFSIPTNAVTNAMLANSSLTVTAGGGLTGGGLVSLGGSTSLAVASGGITNAMLANSSLTVSAGTGLSGGGSVSLGGTTTLSLPNTGTSGTYGQVTTDAQGRVSAGTTCDETHGGTNQTAYATGDIIYASATNTLAKLAGNTSTDKKILTQTGTGGASQAPAWGNACQADIYTGTGVNTWTKPVGAVMVEVFLVGGGAGGGSGRRGLSGSNRGGGGGGGAGGFTYRQFPAAILGTTETVIVGTGGAGGAAQSTASTDGNNGVVGGSTTFGAWAIASPGGAGAKGTVASGAGGSGGVGQEGGGAGGAGAQSADAIIGTGTNDRGGGGGGGGQGTTTSTVFNAAGGGSTGQACRSTSLSGGANTGASAGTSAATNEPQGGAGGGGGVSGGAGGNGGLYGGGGGGGGRGQDTVNSSGAGGNGAQGIAIVISWF